MATLRSYKVYECISEPAPGVLRMVDSSDLSQLLENLPGPLYILVIMGGVGKSTVANAMVVEATGDASYSQVFGVDCMTNAVHVVVVPRRKGGHWMILVCEGTEDGGEECEADAKLLACHLAVTFCAGRTHVFVVSDTSLDDARRLMGSGNMGLGGPPSLVRSVYGAHLVPKDEKPEPHILVSQPFPLRDRETPEDYLQRRLCGSAWLASGGWLRETYGQVECHVGPEDIADPFKALCPCARILQSSKPAEITALDGSVVTVTGKIWLEHIKGLLWAANKGTLFNSPFPLRDQLPNLLTAAGEWEIFRTEHELRIPQRTNSQRSDPFWTFGNHFISKHRIPTKAGTTKTVYYCKSADEWFLDTGKTVHMSSQTCIHGKPRQAPRYSSPPTESGRRRARTTPLIQQLEVDLPSADDGPLDDLSQLQSHEPITASEDASIASVTQHSPQAIQHAFALLGDVYDSYAGTRGRSGGDGLEVGSSGAVFARYHQEQGNLTMATTGRASGLDSGGRSSDDQSVEDLPHTSVGATRCSVDEEAALLMLTMREGTGSRTGVHQEVGRADPDPLPPDPQDHGRPQSCWTPGQETEIVSSWYHIDHGSYKAHAAPTERLVTAPRDSDEVRTATSTAPLGIDGVCSRSPEGQLPAVGTLLQVIREPAPGHVRVVHSDEVKRIRQLRGPLYVIVVMGMFRAGKSTFCNALVAEALGLQGGTAEGFRVGAGVCPVTPGMDVVAVPRVEGGHYVIVDCEGFYQCDDCELKTAQSAVGFCAGRTHVYLTHCPMGPWLDYAGRVMAGGNMRMRRAGHSIVIDGCANLVPTDEKPDAHVLVNDVALAIEDGEAALAFMRRQIDEAFSSNNITPCFSWQNVVNTYHRLQCHIWERRGRKAPLDSLRGCAREVLGSAKPAQLRSGFPVSGGMWLAYIEAVSDAATQGLVVRGDQHFTVSETVAMANEHCEHVTRMIVEQWPVPSLTEYEPPLQLAARLETRTNEVLGQYDDAAAMWDDTALSAVSARWRSTVEAELQGQHHMLSQKNDALGLQPAAQTVESRNMPLPDTEIVEVRRAVGKRIFGRDTEKMWYRRYRQFQMQVRSVVVLHNGHRMEGVWQDVGPPTREACGEDVWCS